MHYLHVVEDVCLVTEGRDGGQYGFFVHPGEVVTLPFKYQCFSHQPVHNNHPTQDGDAKLDSGIKSIKVGKGYTKIVDGEGVGEGEY